MKRKTETRGGLREGAGRKPLPPDQRMTTINISLPPHLLEYLDATVRVGGVSRSAFIALMLVDAKRADERARKMAGKMPQIIL